jgi:plasmid stability protein
MSGVEAMREHSEGRLTLRKHRIETGMMVRIRNVPLELHRRLKARAATEGLSISEYVLREVRKVLDRPTRQEVLDRLQAQPLRRLRRSAAEMIRAQRDSR